jgi:hypothetical protein
MNIDRDVMEMLRAKERELLATREREQNQLAHARGSFIMKFRKWTKLLETWLVRVWQQARGEEEVAVVGDALDKAIRESVWLEWNWMNAFTCENRKQTLDAALEDSIIMMDNTSSSSSSSSLVQREQQAYERMKEAQRAEKVAARDIKYTNSSLAGVEYQIRHFSPPPPPPSISSSSTKMDIRCAVARYGGVTKKNKKK